MKKQWKAALLICLLLFSCVLLFAACDSEKESEKSIEETKAFIEKTTDTKNQETTTLETTHTPKETTSPETTHTPKETTSPETSVTTEAPGTSVYPEEGLVVEKYQTACNLLGQNKIAESYSLLKEISDYAPAKEKLKNFFYAPAKVTDTSIYSSSNTPSITTTEYKYDTNGNITEIKQGNNTATFIYDVNGNVLIGCDLLSIWSGNSTYTYNQNGLLIKETNKYGDVTSYEYDEKGLLVKKFWVGLNKNTKEESDLIDTYEYEFYSNGTIKTMTHKEDPNYLIDSQITKYIFNEQGNLIRIEETPSNKANENAVITTITYGEKGIVSAQKEFEDSKVVITYSYDSNGGLSRVDASEYYENKLYCTYIYTFENNQLFYSENKNTQERVSIVNQTHPEIFLMYLS